MPKPAATPKKPVPEPAGTVEPTPPTPPTAPATPAAVVKPAPDKIGEPAGNLAARGRAFSKRRGGG